MEQRSQGDPDVHASSEEAKVSTETPVLESCSSAPNTPSVAPARPKRPQRSPRVEGSTDISDPELHEEKASQSTGPAQQLRGDKPSTSRPSALAGPAAAVRSHITMRAASLPQAPSDHPPLTDPSIHPQRALSVAGTADTKPHSEEDFR